MPPSTLRFVFRLSIATLCRRLGKNSDFAQSTSSVLESSLQQVWDPARLQSDPTKLLPQLLDQLIALGQTAQQLRHTLGGNGHQTEKIEELMKQLARGGDHAH